MGTLSDAFFAASHYRRRPRSQEERGYEADTNAAAEGMPRDEEAVARRFESPDGMVVLVGKSARDNDVLTFKVATQKDFWMHVASESGSHVVVRNPENLEALPPETLLYAASLAARYSKARNAKKVAVHVARRKDVHKPRGMPAGKVVLKRYKSVKVEPLPE